MTSSVAGLEEVGVHELQSFVSVRVASSGLDLKTAARGALVSVMVSWKMWTVNVFVV